MKKFLSAVFILILFTLISVCASAENLLEGSSFDTPEDGEFWSGGTIDESAAVEGASGYIISNPFGETKNGLITHVLEYNNSVCLEKGKIYRLSGKVLNPCSEILSTCRTRASLTPGSKSIIINISGSDYEWGEFSTTFYVSDTDEYNLSFYFENGDEVIGFFTDNLVLEEQNLQIASMEIPGPESVLIPAEGNIKTTFSPVLLTNEGTSVNLLLGTDLTVSSKFNTPGVEFHTDTAILTVYHDAVPESVITINCLLQLPEGNITATKEVTLTDNLIENSDFESLSPDEFWHSDSAISSSFDDVNGTFLETSTNSYGQHGYYTTIYYSVPQVLVGGSLYVLHAQIKSDCPVENTAIYNGGATLTADNTVVFNIPDISSNTWTDVSAAFVPENSGIYEIAVTFWSRYDCTISADNIRLCCETLRPSSITMHAPGNIALPDTECIYPIRAYVRDQLGNIIENEKCIFTYENIPEAPLFSAEDNTLTVFPDTAEGTYLFSAYSENNPSLTSTIEISVSTHYIGDGGFENKAVNEWWLASSDGNVSFTINDAGNNKYAHIENNNGFFFMLNNSYMHLMENVAYVLMADIRTDSNVTVTAFIENLNGEAIPLAQFNASDKISATELFLSESTDTGRLLLYIESENYPFTVDIDNIQLKKAIVSASNAEMSGDFSVNGTAKADFTFFNNIANSDDTSACVINWYISDSYSDKYTQLPESGAYIYFDTSFADKYVYFEVTPICPGTGFSGNTLRSLPKYISFKNGSDDSFAENLPSDIPQKPQQIPQFTPVSLPTEYYNTFTDTENHWAKDYIAALTSVNVINGRDSKTFDPDAFVTRAEFSKMLCLAFGMAQKTGNVFSDISPDSWYSPYVNTLYENEIIKGVSENLFAPDKEITREEAAVILMRAYEKFTGALPQKTGFRFYDDSSISQWASDFVYGATSLSVITGFQDGVFLPQDSVSRSQSAAMIFRMLTALQGAERI